MSEKESWKYVIVEWNDIDKITVSVHGEKGTSKKVYDTLKPHFRNIILGKILERKIDD